MLAAADADYRICNVAQKFAEETARRDDERREPVQGGLAGGGDEVVMKSPEEIVGGHPPWLALSQVCIELGWTWSR